MEMSLEELKRENAKAESETQDEPQLEEEETTEAVEEPEDETVEAEGSDDTEESEEETIEAWMQSDDQTSQDGEKTVPESDLIKMRQKLRAKNREKADRIEQLEQEIEALKAKPQQAITPTGKPKRDDFLDAEDPDEAYFDALSDWKLSERAKQEEQASQSRQQQAQAAKLEEQVEAHYTRAVKLLDEHKLNADVYKSADSGFRQALDEAFPGKGDMVADTFISQIGEGSEKLVMYIGNNEGRKQQLKTALSSDPSGMKAMRLMGKWETEMVAPKTRSSKAPKPAVRVKSGETVDMSSSMLKKYKDAHKNGNSQKAFDIKRQARSNNIDVSKW